MSFNRRRASLACTFCRRRKRRCDTSRPVCANCQEAGADCFYDDLPSQRIDPSMSSTEILDKLNDIESLIERQTQSVAALSSQINPEISHRLTMATSPTSYTSINDRRLSHSVTGMPNEMGHPSSPWHQNERFQSLEVETPPLTIPVKHNTSSSYLLSLPEMQELIGNYPRDILFAIESRRALPPELTFDGALSISATSAIPIRIDRETTDRLVLAFFSHAYPCHPILDHESFETIYNKFLETGVDSSIESTLCLIVLALGSVIMAPGVPSVDAQGLRYMEAAMPTLISVSSWSFSVDLIIPQALVLGSMYFSYIVRPLQSWRLAYSACTILQFRLTRLARDANTSTRESILRLFWSCFLVECDRLAELELPQSGLQQLIDEAGLPSCNNLDPAESTCYLAEISIRRLLNRIHNTLYPQNQMMSTLSPIGVTTTDDLPARSAASVRAICDELHRQLDMWYDSIPEQFRPPLGVETITNDRKAVLRIRYYATKHIIYRPFVLHVVAQGMSLFPDHLVDQILEKCGICIESCRLYLYNTTEMLKRPSQYTWTFSISSLGAIVVLTLASRTLNLKHLVPDISELQTLVIKNLTPWATVGSSLEAVISIIQDMQRKQRLLDYV